MVEEKKNKNWYFRFLIGKKKNRAHRSEIFFFNMNLYTLYSSGTKLGARRWQDTCGPRLIILGCARHKVCTATIWWFQRKVFIIFFKIFYHFILTDFNRTITRIHKILLTWFQNFACGATRSYRTGGITATRIHGNRSDFALYFQKSNSKTRIHKV